jgi:hypothetical protein
MLEKKKAKEAKNRSNPKLDGAGIWAKYEMTKSSRGMHRKAQINSVGKSILSL